MSRGIVHRPPRAKRICGAAVGAATVVPSGENVRVPLPLAALGRGGDDREAYVGVGYRGINDKVVLVDTLLADPTLEDLSEGQILVLETLMQFVHTCVLKRDSLITHTPLIRTPRSRSNIIGICRPRHHPPAFETES